MRVAITCTPIVGCVTLLLAIALMPFANTTFHNKPTSQRHNAVVEPAGDTAGPMPAGSLPYGGSQQTAESWDAPVLTVEREETVNSAAKQPMDDDHGFQHVHDTEHEQIEKNHVADAARFNKKIDGPTTTTPTPSSASRVSTAGTVAFTLALLLVLEM